MARLMVSKWKEEKKCWKQHRMQRFSTHSIDVTIKWLIIVVNLYTKYSAYLFTSNPNSRKLGVKCDREREKSLVAGDSIDCKCFLMDFTLPLWLRSFSCSRSRLACRVESKQRLGSFTLCSVPLVSHSHSLHFSVSTFTARSCTIMKFEPFLLQFYCIFDLQTPLNLFTSASDSNLVSNKMTSFLNLCEFFSLVCKLITVYIHQNWCFRSIHVRHIVFVLLQLMAQYPLHCIPFQFNFFFSFFSLLLS